MNIDKLTQGDLLKIRDNINSRLEYISELKELKKSSKDKNALSDLDKTDKIFSINFYGSKLYQMDYVKISFNEREIDTDWVGFSTSHDTKPMGCCSAVRKECMGNHFFLSEFCSSMYFFTLKPESWKEDLKSELIRLTRFKENNFNNEIKQFEDKVNTIIENNEIDILLSDLKN